MTIYFYLYNTIYSIQFNWAFGIAPYGMPSIMEGALQLFLCQATVTHCVIPIVEGGATPSQINSLGSIQACHLMRGSASFVWPLLAALMLTHSQ